MEVVVKKKPDLDVEATFYMQPSDSIEKLKEMIEEKLAIPRAEQILSYANELMESGTLSSFNVKKGSYVFVERESDGKMQIFVKTLRGKTITIDIKPNDYVKVLKEEIEYKEGYPPEAQHLIYGGKSLQNEHKLSYYCIRKEATIHLTFRLPGGMLTF